MSAVASGNSQVGTLDKETIIASQQVIKEIRDKFTSACLALKGITLSNEDMKAFINMQEVTAEYVKQMKGLIPGAFDDMKQIHDLMTTTRNKLKGGVSGCSIS